MVSVVQIALFVAFSLVLASSLLITSLFKFKTIIPYILSVYLLTFTNILFAGELAGLFSLLNNRFFFLLIHILILIVAFIVWKKKGSPELFTPIKLAWNDLKAVSLWTRLKKHPILFILGLGVSAFYLVEAILVVAIPPNNYDSMTCHMARIGYWLQHGNFLPWATWFPTQIEYPINAQVQILWSLLFWRTDTFAGFTDWFAAIISILAVYGIARCFQMNRSKAIFASLVFSLFPQILLQSSTTMTHLLAAALFLCAFYLLFLGFQDHSRIFLVLSGLSISLAIGVHLFVLFALPGYACSALFLCIKNRKIFKQAFKSLLLSSMLSILLFGSYIFIQNFIFYRNPIGQGLSSSTWTISSNSNGNGQESYWNLKNVIKYTFYNINRYIFASYDLTGIPNDLSETLYKIRDAIAIPFYEFTKMPKQAGEFDINYRMNLVSENSAWFGLVGFLLFYPLLIAGSITAIKKKDPVRGILIINIIIYTLVWSTLIAREHNWSMYSGRYFVPVALLFAPLIAMVYKKGFWYKLVCFCIVLASFYIGYRTTINNYAKPLTGQAAILKWDRVEKFSSVGWDQYPILMAVENNVPQKTIMGLAINPLLMEYPYFGQYLQRKLVPIYPYDKMDDTQWLKDNNVDWILTCVDTNAPKGFEIMESIKLKQPIGISSECIIYNRK